MAAVDLWCWFTAALDPRVVDGLSAGLSADERERAARFLRAPDRRDYVAAHALVRHALSRHRPSRRPDEWRFSRDAHGKPSLANEPDSGVPTFNLSHAPGLVACAVADGAAVGVDVELVARRTNADVTARERFTDDEVREIDALAEDDRAARFTEVWTLREAYVKGVGVGLWGPDVPALSFSFPERDRLECRRSEPASAWEFALLTLEGYRMAVAVDVPASARGRWALSLNVVVAEGTVAGLQASTEGAGLNRRATGALMMEAPRLHDAAASGLIT